MKPKYKNKVDAYRKNPKESEDEKEKPEKPKEKDKKKSKKTKKKESSEEDSSDFIKCDSCFDGDADRYLDRMYG